MGHPMSDLILQLRTRHGAELEGSVMGNGGFISQADVLRREIDLAEGTAHGVSRIYQPRPGTCKLHLRSERWRAGDDPAASVVLDLAGLQVVGESREEECRD